MRDKSPKQLDTWSPEELADRLDHLAASLIGADERKVAQSASAWIRTLERRNQILRDRMRDYPNDIDYAAQEAHRSIDKLQSRACDFFRKMDSIISEDLETITHAPSDTAIPTRGEMVRQLKRLTPVLIDVFATGDMGFEFCALVRKGVIYPVPGMCINRFGGDWPPNSWEKTDKRTYARNLKELLLDKEWIVTPWEEITDAEICRYYEQLNQATTTPATDSIE